MPVDSSKETILESFYGGRCQVVLIDDSITRDHNFSISASESRAMHCVDLPFEGPGLDDAHLEAVTELVARVV